MTGRDNEAYWIDRHEKLEGSLATVGKIGTPEAENRQRYARKKKRVFDLFKSMGRSDLSGTSILDAGCGVGLISEVLYLMGADVHGVDASERAIAETMDRCDNRDNDKFKSGSILDFNFYKSFDYVLCLDVLYHVVDDDNWTSAVSNLIRHTVDGGSLILLDQIKPTAERPASHVRFRTRQMYDDVAHPLVGDQVGEFLIYRKPEIN